MRSISRLRVTSSAVRIGAAASLVLAVGGSLGMQQATAASSGHCRPTISSKFLGNFSDAPYHGKKPVFRYTLTSCHGMQVKLLTYGAIQQSITVPGRNGKKANVILGFRTLADYMKEVSPPPPLGGPYFGETVGRYANRIAKGTFTLKQHGVRHTYTLPINNGVNALHGGFVGFGNHIWTARKLPSTAHSVGVAMTIVSPNGDEGSRFEPSCHCTGYPGKLKLTVTFLLTTRNQLVMHYHATVKGANTVINVTNHDYFNLAGEASGTVYQQRVQINANKYTPTDKTQIPTGAMVPVAGTPFDFRAPHTIGSRINEANRQLLIAQGYDHNWVLNKSGPTRDGLRLAARAWDPRSGRKLTVWTDEPGVQFYSGNFLNGTLVGISGHIYRQSDGYTFETQHFPNSPNQPSFPSTELKPGQQFNSTTIYQFSTF